MTPPFAESARLAALPAVRHGFFGREGGVSTGIYDSLNCGLGSDDDWDAIVENRARLARAVGATPEALLSPYQHHSADVVTVTEPWTWKTMPKADACVSATPGLALAVSTADCVPVLFADAEARVVGAAHAGWRGALCGVLANTVAAMEALGAARGSIVAAVGPCIRQASYQVGDDLRTAFVDADPANDRFFAPDAEDAARWRFDLAGAVRARLADAGVGTIEDLDIDTYADADRYFSYRRSTHRKEPDYGRSLSAIVLTAPV
jgi:YfiH family protein